MTPELVLYTLASLSAVTLGLAGIVAPFSFREGSVPLMKVAFAFAGLALVWAAFTFWFVEGRAFGL